MCCVPPGTKGQLSYKLCQSSNHIYFNFILLAEPLTDEGVEEICAPGKTKQNKKKNAGDKLQKMLHTKARKFKPKRRLEPAL